MKKTLLILALLLSFGCSSNRIIDIIPSEYVFENDYIQSKWSDFLKLDNCEKIDHLDSIYRPILLEEYRLIKENSDKSNRAFDRRLVTGEYYVVENYYYWVFREIQFMTKQGPSTPLTHDGYMGLSNKQVLPYYPLIDSLSSFDVDIKSWKDSLGCD